MADNITFMGIPIEKMTTKENDICFVLYFDTTQVDPPTLSQIYSIATDKLPLPVVAFPNKNLLKLMSREELIFLRERVDNMITECNRKDDAQ